MRTKKVTWQVTIGFTVVIVEARNRGSAVHLACRALGIQKPATDHHTGGWTGVSAEVLKD